MEELNLGFEQLSVVSSPSNLREVIQTILSDQSTLKEEMEKNLRDQLEMNGRIHSLIKCMQHNTFFNDNYFPLEKDLDFTFVEDKIEKKIDADPEFRTVLVLTIYNLC